MNSIRLDWPVVFVAGPHYLWSISRIMSPVLRTSPNSLNV